MQRGITYAALAYTLWGIFPLYFVLLRNVPALEVLAHRIVWSLVVVAMLLAALRRLDWLPAALRDRKVMRAFAASALLIAMNWFFYIWAVQHGRVLDASLGYFITPLANVLMGRLVLGERLRRAQWVAVAIAACGVLWLAAATPTVPWIALVLAATFSTYGLLRKVAPLDALEGLALETLMLGPLALAGLLWAAAHDGTVFQNAAPGLQALLVLAGPLTAAPLLLFAAGARRIPLNVLGMLQYLGPTLQFLIGVLLFNEPFGGTRLIGFVLIWTACALFSADLWRRSRRKGPP